MSIQIEGHEFFRSSEVSSLTGVSKSTIHRWIRAEVIPDVTFKDRNGWRLFSAEDITRIKSERVLDLKELRGKI